MSPKVLPKVKSKRTPSRVAQVIKKTNTLSREYQEKLKPDEKILSFNKVTGFSVNLPISKTCIPTSICAERCYFAVGGPSWPNSLKKQLRLYNSVKDNPKAVAEMLAREISGKRQLPSFLRWNGGGDLFPESIEMIHHLSDILPTLPLWIVTRIPEQAAQLDDHPNIFIHFSLDKKSLDRKIKFEKIKKRSSNYFYSYQCDKGEVFQAQNLSGSSVIFFDYYKLAGDLPKINKSIICPLNTAENITGVCEQCRRCFDGSAVKHSQALRS